MVDSFQQSAYTLSSFFIRLCTKPTVHKDCNRASNSVHCPVLFDSILAIRGPCFELILHCHFLVVPQQHGKYLLHFVQYSILKAPPSRIMKTFRSLGSCHQALNRSIVGKTTQFTDNEFLFQSLRSESIQVDRVRGCGLYKFIIEF